MASTSYSKTVWVASGPPGISAENLNNLECQFENACLVMSSYYAPLASPPLTGTPNAPTAAVGTDNTQLATTAFVQAGGTAWANWVPTLTWKGADPTVVTSAYRYKKFGKICYVTIYISMTADYTTTGLTITNLPVVPTDNSARNAFSCVMLYYNNNYAPIACLLNQNAQSISITAYPANAVSYTGYIAIEGWYEVA